MAKNTPIFSEHTIRFFQISTLMSPWFQATSAVIMNGLILNTIYGGNGTLVHWTKLAMAASSASFFSSTWDY